MSVFIESIHSHNTKLQIAFFDNSNGNILPCKKSSQKLQEGENVEVMCVKVKETTKERANDNHQKVMRYFQDKETNADVRFNAEVLHCLYGRSAYFDAQSGIQANEFSDTKTPIGSQAQKADLWVFDWDRTISQAEGFYGASDRSRTAGQAWNVYKKNVKNLYKERCSNKSWYRSIKEFNRAFTPENQIKMLCGGTERYENLKHVFSSKSVNDIYIITANPCVKMIYFFARFLFPNIPEDHVMTVHQHQALHDNSPDQKFQMIMKLVVPIHERRNVSLTLLKFFELSILKFQQVFNATTQYDSLNCNIHLVEDGKITGECYLPYPLSPRDDWIAQQSYQLSDDNTHTTYSNPHLF